VVQPVKPFFQGVKGFPISHRRKPFGFRFGFLWDAMFFNSVGDSRGNGVSGKIEAPGIFKLSKKGFRNYSVIFYLGTLWFTIASVTAGKTGKTKGRGPLG
jgi:hypothetical protein